MTNVPLQGDGDSGAAVHMWGQRVCGTSLPLSVAEKLKCLLKIVKSQQNKTKK